MAATTAGNRRQRVFLEKRSTKMEWGQQVLSWERAGTVYAYIVNETGVVSARTNVLSGIPASTTRYSFDVDVRVVNHYGIGTDHRFVHPVDGTVFSVTGVVRDYGDARRAYVTTTVGLSND